MVDEPTGAERYFLEQLQDPEYRKAYENRIQCGCGKPITYRENKLVHVDSRLDHHHHPALQLRLFKEDCCEAQ